MSPTARKRCLTLSACFAAAWALSACTGARAPSQPTPAAAVSPEASTAPTAAARPASPPPTTPDHLEGSAAPATPSCRDDTGCPSTPALVGEFSLDAAPEASGIAASLRNPGVLYILDDGPGTSSILAVSLDGQLVAELGVGGFEGYDTEALAVGECEPGGGPTCIYIGDIGDNLAARDGIVVYRIEEPDLSRGGPDSPLVPAAIHLRYPSGPVDAEALLVEAGVPYIVTKQAAEADGAGRARLYSAPGFSDGDLIDLGEVAVPEPTLALVRSVTGNVVTAGDSRPGRVLLRTYDHVVEYVAEDPGAPLSQFPQWPVREVESVRQQQGEAIAYLADECGYALVSEASGEIWTAGCGR